MPQDPAIKKVFLSSTGRDLTEHRFSTYKAIESLNGYHCVRMEDFTSQPTKPLSYLREIIPTCHLFITLAGVCYGSVPKGESRSYTELEYEAAVAAKIPSLAFALPRSYPISPDIVHEDGRWDDQMRFRDIIDAQLLRKEFSDPHQLATQVVAAIHNVEYGNRLSPGEVDRVDCVILCGGYAKRLFPLTIDISKVTLPVGGKSILTRVIALVRKSKAIQRITLSVNEKYAYQINDIVAKNVPDAIPPIELVVEPSHSADEKLGPIGALDFLLEQREYHNLLVIGADNLFEFSIDDFLKFAGTRHGSSNAVYSFPSYEDASEYGVAHLGPNDEFLDFREKEKVAVYRDVSAACYLFRQSDLELIRCYLETGNDPDSLGGFLHWLTKNGSPMSGYRFTSPWFDIGTREKLLAANMRYIVDSRLGNISNSEITGPVQASTRCTIVNSVVGPNVYIGPNAQIYDTYITNSMIMDDTTVRRGNVRDSVVGPGSEIEGRVSEMVCGPMTRLIRSSSNS